MEVLPALIITTALFGMSIMQPVMADAQEQLALVTSNEAESSAIENGSEAGVRQKVKENIDAIKSYSSEKREVAMQRAKAALDDFDIRVDEMGKQIEEKQAKWSEAIKTKKQRMLDELGDEREEVGKHYEGLKHSSKEAWEDTKNTFIKTYRQLEHKYQIDKSKEYRDDGSMNRASD